MKQRYFFVITTLTFVTIFLIAFLTGCPNPTITSATLSPPAWIIGSWSDEYSANNYTFSANNVVFSAGGYSIDFQQLNDDFADQGEAGSGYYDSTPSSTAYTIDYKDNYTTLQTLVFQQTSATTIDYSVDMSGVTIGPINLIKQ